MTKVSVIIPTFNRADLVGRALQSVIDQTETDWECIVVDDGSTDNTRDVVSQYSDSRIRYVYQENQKLPAARNRGVRESRADFIAFLDSDDAYLPEKIAVQLKFLIDHPEYGLVTSGWRDVDWDGKFLRDILLWNHQLDLDLEKWLFGCPAIVPAVLVRKSHLEQVGFFDAEQHYMEDRDLWLRMAYAGCRMVWLPATVCLRTIHSGGMSRNIEAMKNGLFRLLEKFYSQPNLPASLLSQRDRVFAQAHLDCAARALGAGQPNRASNHLGEMIRLDPLAQSDVPPRFMQSLASAALTPIAPDIQIYLIAWLQALEELGNAHHRTMHQLKAMVHATRAFEESQKSHPGRARLHALWAITLDISWMKNRGLIRILVLPTSFGK